MRKVLPLALFLIFTAAGLIFYKARVLGFPLIPDESSSYWLVESHLSFQGSGKAVTAKMFLPKTSKSMLIVDESFVSRGYGLSTSEDELNRLAEWTVRRATGTQGLYYRALVLKQDGESSFLEDEPAVPNVSTLDGAVKEIALLVLNDAQQKSVDELSLAKNVVSILKERGASGELKPLVSKKDLSSARLRVAADIILLAGTPARVVRGVVLTREARRIEPVSRLEVKTKDGWIAIGADGTEAGTSDLFLPWWRGNDALATVDGGRALNTSISIRQIEEEAVSKLLRVGEKDSSPLIALSLIRLPVELQSLFRVLLLVPFGALVIVILRNIVGLSMTGTFMPVLLALAFRETTIWWGIIIFSLLTACGLTVRAYLEKLRLLVLPRVGGVLTVVVLLMAIICAITYKAGFEIAHSVALFPMIVITMMIERTSLLWEEFGPKKAFSQWLSGLFGAVVVYYSVLHDLLSFFLLLYPETLLAVLGLMILLGRYTGYRLSEVVRFKDIS